jgi:hypothetical protein
VTRRALVAAGLVALAFALALLDTPLCPTAFFFGVPCPGCGLTRATLALLHGDFAAALRFHPLAPLLAPLFAGALAKVLIDYVRGGQPRPAPGWWTSRTTTLFASGLLALILGVWVARFAGYFGGPVPVESWRTRFDRPLSRATESRLFKESAQQAPAERRLR